MKRKILIIHPSMEIGGAERALLGLLDSLDYSRFDVDLLLCSHTGDFLPLINVNVNRLPYDKRFDFFLTPVSKLIKQGQLLKAALRVCAKWKEKRRQKNEGVEHSVWHAQQIIHRMMEPLLPKVSGEYDLAINFLGIPSILVKSVEAKVKMTWVHTDYSKIVADPALDKRMYDQVDYIVNVSDDCKRIFDSFYPEYRAKSLMIENILNATLVKKLANEDFDYCYESNTTNLLSIGRFGYAKNFESIPLYCSLMREAGVRDFRWYIVGYGSMEGRIRENIDKYGVKDQVIILGKKVNPYPYIKNCDIYVQPSRFEGKAVTVQEAQMLGKPVVVTDFKTASSQIHSGIDGIILPSDPEVFTKELAKIIADKNRTDALALYCNSHNFGNETETEKIYRTINLDT